RIVTAPKGSIEKAARRTGIEAAARDFRHATLRKEAENLNARFILIAHTRDDMLENTLLRILRGAGPAGLAMIPERNGFILRPLISVSRAEIIEYLSERGFSWREDSSNKDERYLRNRVRRRLKPLLDEYFPDWRQNIAALAETQAIIAEFLYDEVSRRIDWKEGSGGKLNCALQKFAAESQIIREEALFIAHDSVTARKSDDGDGADVDTARRIIAPRRASLRKAAITLGSMEVAAQDGIVTASPSKQYPLEECASILIDKPGVYRLKNLSIECVAECAAVSGQSCRLIVREAAE
ncbi:MAG: tRNA lysidine(34) synthetase TilS, partial [Spirochaetaceae bacterium]|nr:tRNA lysidine(34) synthetase TilS [Spirochaetaceae bacterium]